MGPCEAFYQSPIQHPILLWAAAGAALLWVRRRSALDFRMGSYCRGLVALSLLDAWLTAQHVYGIGTLEGGLARGVPLFFVLAGDLRYLLLLGIATPAGGLAPSASRVVSAVLLTLLVPLLSQAAMTALPEGWNRPRVLFFVYEALFCALTLALLRWHPGPRRAPWLRGVSRFVLLYYGLWALADAILLATGADAGFALRVLPNLLYYGGLIAVIASAAERARSGRT